MSVIININKKCFLTYTLLLVILTKIIIDKKNHVLKTNTFFYKINKSYQNIRTHINEIMIKK